MDKTPKRQVDPGKAVFSPITLPESPAAESPQKNLTGVPRVARDLVADIYNNIQRWNDYHIKGVHIVKQIASFKQSQQDSLTQLEELTTQLFEIVQRIEAHSEALRTFKTQAIALEQLQQKSTPLFISHNAHSLANLIREVIEAYEDELKVKEFVLENIAHLNNVSDAMFLAALWTYQTKINNLISMKLEVLLVEAGHRKYN